MLKQVGLGSLIGSLMKMGAVQNMWLTGRGALLWMLLGSLLAACTGGTVVFAPTPLPPDLSPRLYTHPSAAFSIALPPDWAVFAPESADLAQASFSAPNQAGPQLRVMVANLGVPIETQAFADLMNQYQSQIRPDLRQYTEQDRQSMADGSWRMVGLRQDAAGNTEQVNTFFQRDGALLAIIEIEVSEDAAQLARLERAVNTFSLNAAAGLPTVSLSALASSSGPQLQIVSLNSWTTEQGVFFITGEVQNNTYQDWPPVPVRAAIYAEDGAGLAEARDLVMGHAIPARGFAPFSLRFGQGQPQAGRDLEVTLGDMLNVDTPEATVLSAPLLTWDDQIDSGPDGQRYVSGTIRNEGDVTVRQARAVVTLFDEQGRIVGARFVDAEDEILAPGASSSFSIDVPDLGGLPATYIVNVQALVCQPDESC